MGPPHEGSIRRPIAPRANALPLSYVPLQNVLFNDALNTFYLRLYGVRHMVKDSEEGNPLPLQGLFYMHHPTDRITHTTAFVTPVMLLRLEQEIAQWVHHEGSIWRPIAPWALLPWSYISLLWWWNNQIGYQISHENQLTWRTGLNEK